MACVHVCACVARAGHVCYCSGRHAVLFPCFKALSSLSNHSWTCCTGWYSVKFHWSVSLQSRFCPHMNFVTCQAVCIACLPLQCHRSYSARKQCVPSSPMVRSSWSNRKVVYKKLLPAFGCCVCTVQSECCALSMWVEFWGCSGHLKVVLKFLVVLTCLWLLKMKRLLKFGLERMCQCTGLLMFKSGQLALVSACAVKPHFVMVWRVIFCNRLQAAHKDSRIQTYRFLRCSFSHNYTKFCDFSTQHILHVLIFFYLWQVFHKKKRNRIAVHHFQLHVCKLLPVFSQITNSRNLQR